MKFRGEQVTFLGWLDNVWYHYKAHIIIGAFALAIAVTGITQCAAKKYNDVFIYYIGEHSLTVEAREMFVNDVSESFFVDSNDDKECVVDIKYDSFKLEIDELTGKPTIDKDAYEGNTIAQRFNLEVMNGDCIIYIMEPAFFNANLDYLASFEEELGYVPEKAIKGKGIKLSDLDFYWQEYYGEEVAEIQKQTSTLGYFSGDYIICLADRESRFDDDYYDGNVEFLRKLIEFKHDSAK